MLSQVSFANAKMMDDSRSLSDDRLGDIKRSAAVKHEEFATLYNLQDAALSAAVGAQGLSRSLSDHTGKHTYNLLLLVHFH